MDDRKIFTIHGNNINTLPEFHDEIQRVLCPGFKHYGRSWDALNDILRGGFRTFELDEKITIIFKNKKHVRKSLGEGFLNRFTKLVEQHNHIKLLFE